MNFKKGDKVRLTETGVITNGHWFDDDVYEGLEVKNVGVSSLRLLQNDRTTTWHVPKDYCELMVSNDPKTWKRNKPIIIEIDSGRYIPAHFSHHEDGRVYVYKYGKTSFTANKQKTFRVRKWKLPTKEELG